MNTRVAILIILFAWLGIYASSAQTTPGTFAIVDVNVIPMDRETVLTHQTVLIKAGKITGIVPASGAKIPADAQKIDGKGKYLLPGLTDMHAHFFYEQGIDKSYIPEELKMMLANGVTTARIMNGCDLYRGAKDKIAQRQIIGPELFMTSPQFVGQWPWKNDTISPKQVVANAKDAEDAVRKYKREGYDAIKITFFIRKAAYDATIKTAAEENIKVTGHIGHDVKLPAALAAHQQIEHLDEFIEMLLPDTSTARYSVSGPEIWLKKAWLTVKTLDENKIPALVKMVKDAGVFISPTNYFFKTNFGLGQTDEEIKNSDDYKFIPQKLLPERAETRDAYWNKVKIDQADRERWYTLRKKIIKALSDAGVPLMSGSDAPEWYMVQGFSVHNEIASTVECGLSNYEALKTSTVTPCTYLGIIDRKGTIAPGKDADMILLDKNPLDDIRNTKTISGVFRDGVFYSRNDIDNLLQQVLAANAKL